MHLLLSSSSDLPAFWAFEALRGGPLPSLELITSETLAYCCDWEHRVGADGVHISFRLPDGRQVDGSQIDGVLNRLMIPPQELISQAVPADRDYAQQEISALYLSWLHGLRCPVLNRPTPQGMAGRWRHASEWAMAAHEAGFTVPRYKQTEDDPADRGYLSFAPTGASVTRLVTFDREVFGADLPAAVKRNCLQLAELCDTRLLGIDLFSTIKDQWVFAAATPMPDLQIGGLPLLNRLAQALCN